MGYVIEMLNITKEFPGIKANDDITFRVKEGEIHALLGENGAGKSTLMSILFGLYQCEAGEIRVRGEKVQITGPSIANDLGIGMVHQHFKLVKSFTITENIILGMETVKSLGRLDTEVADKKIQSLSERYGLNVDPNARIEDISVGMEQRVEILKMLYRKADILIFDEPTAVLTPQEITELMKVMRALTKEGKSIILITHKLKEIKAVADRCTILRRGRYIDTVDVAQSTEKEMAQMMVGREVDFTVEKTPVDPQEKVLEVQSLGVRNSRGLVAVRQVSFDVYAGEIFCIAGIEGNGQSELIQAITGLRKVEAGQILYQGKNLVGRSIRECTEAGLGHIPEDRHKHGLILDFSLEDNLVLQSYYKRPFCQNGLLRFHEIRGYADFLIEEFDIRSSRGPVTSVRSMSGGNQQKAIIAREVERSPSLLIAAQPTRGLDVGAIEYIHKRLVRERDKGRAVLLMSLELDEVLGVADRIAVMYKGEIVGIVNADETSENALGLMMSGSMNQGGIHECS